VGCRLPALLVLGRQLQWHRGAPQGARGELRRRVRGPIRQIGRIRGGWDGTSTGFVIQQTFNYDYNASFRPEQLADGAAFYNYADSHGSRAASDDAGDRLALDTSPARRPVKQRLLAGTIIDVSSAVAVETLQPELGKETEKEDRWQYRD
jgi:hypothetical protein